ncbi:MAG: hypothetical protein JNL01_13620 [Bdellovibrionales bacterium]|nr:hypothetical protein [Bdellovibrionales bacterium]
MNRLFLLPALLSSALAFGQIKPVNRPSSVAIKMIPGTEKISTPVTVYYKDDATGSRVSQSMNYNSTIGVQVNAPEVCIEIQLPFERFTQCGIAVTPGILNLVNLDLGAIDFQVPSTAFDVDFLPEPNIHVTGQLPAGETGRMEISAPTGNLGLTRLNPQVINLYGSGSRLLQATVTPVRGQLVPYLFQVQDFRVGLKIVRDPVNFPLQDCSPGKELDLNFLSTTSDSTAISAVVPGMISKSIDWVKNKWVRSRYSDLKQIQFPAGKNETLYYGYNWSRDYLCTNMDCMAMTYFDPKVGMRIRRIEVDHIRFSGSTGTQDIPGEFTVYEDRAGTISRHDCKGQVISKFKTRTGIDVLPGKYTVEVTHTRPDGQKVAQVFRLDYSK